MCARILLMQLLIFCLSFSEAQAADKRRGAPIRSGLQVQRTVTRTDYNSDQLLLLYIASSSNSFIFETINMQFLNLTLNTTKPWPT